MSMPSLSPIVLQAGHDGHPPRRGNAAVSSLPKREKCTYSAGDMIGGFRVPPTNPLLPALRPGLHGRKATASSGRSSPTPSVDDACTPKSRSNSVESCVSDSIPVSPLRKGRSPTVQYEHLHRISNSEVTWHDLGEAPTVTPVETKGPSSPQLPPATRHMRVQALSVGQLSDALPNPRRAGHAGDAHSKSFSGGDSQKRSGSHGSSPSALAAQAKAGPDGILPPILSIPGLTVRPAALGRRARNKSVPIDGFEGSLERPVHMANQKFAKSSRCSSPGSQTFSSGPALEANQDGGSGDTGNVVRRPSVLVLVDGETEDVVPDLGHQPQPGASGPAFSQTGAVSAAELALIAMMGDMHAVNKLRRASATDDLDLQHCGGSGPLLRRFSQATARAILQLDSAATRAMWAKAITSVRRKLVAAAAGLMTSKQKGASDGMYDIVNIVLMSGTAAGKKSALANRQSEGGAAQGKGGRGRCPKYDYDGHESDGEDVESGVTKRIIREAHMETLRDFRSHLDNLAAAKKAGQKLGRRRRVLSGHSDATTSFLSRQSTVSRTVSREPSLGSAMSPNDSSPQLSNEPSFVESAGNGNVSASGESSPLGSVKNKYLPATDRRRQILPIIETQEVAELLRRVNDTITGYGVF